MQIVLTLISLQAATGAGEGIPYYTECDTNPVATKPPAEPRFKKTVMYPNGDRARIKVTWQPDIQSGNPGSHFYVQYRKSGDLHFLTTKEEFNEDR